jgi:RNA polymerase sigma factor
MTSRELDQKAIDAANDPQKLNAFIAQYEPFVLKSVSKAVKRYVSKSDDEWSIALNAFSEAIGKYDYDRGSFIAFAELMIHRRSIDYFRTQEKFNSDVQIGWVEDNAVIDYNDQNLKLEIEAISKVLANYGFSFMDLTNCSPKAKKTKAACAKAVSFLLVRPMLIAEMRNSNQVPIKIIEKNTGLPRKIIERHRKYIIAVVEILNGDYPYISEYLSFAREAVKR